MITAELESGWWPRRSNIYNPRQPITQTN